MRLGELDLKLVSDGGFRLDGGAMFGVVPRTLWERVKPPDERNRIQMTTNCPLVARGGELVLIDSGIGDKNDAKFRAIFGLETGARRLPEAVRAAGYEPDYSTFVVGPRTPCLVRYRRRRRAVVSAPAPGVCPGIEGRHGSAGASRAAPGALGGPFGAPHCTGGAP